MSISIKQHLNHIIISAEGQFVGGEETNILSACIKEAINNGNYKIGINFENISYISSIIIGLLVKTNLELVGKGGKLVVYNVNRAIKNVLKLTRVDTQFPICIDENTAIKHLE